MVQSYFIFGLRGKKYAILTRHVKEIHWLPKLTPLEESPDYVPGVFNLRGQVVPVVDLERRLGYPFRSHHTEEKVVICFWQNTCIGLIVTDIYPLLTIDDAQIEPAPKYGLSNGQTHRYICDIAKSEEQILMVLDLDVLFDSDALEIDPEDEIDFDDERETPRNDAEEALFLARAKQLRESRRMDQNQTIIPLSLVQIGSERLGLKLHEVRSFVDRPAITPVPNCPDHILGVINYRGELVTVLEISKAFGFSGAHQSIEKVAIVDVGQHMVGIGLRDILDVVYMPQSAFQSLSGINRPDLESCLTGAIQYENKMVGVMDLDKLFANGQWLVDQTVY